LYPHPNPPPSRGREFLTFHKVAKPAIVFRRVDA
jgi:hypothetical protein